MRRHVLAASFAVIAACIWTSARYVDPSTGPKDDNPEHFHLWTAGSTFRYAFTYDPRETDIWMMRSGGIGAMQGTSFGPRQVQFSTNQQRGP